jgi:hypothetical protein
MLSDLRIPVVFGRLGEAEPKDVVLAEGDVPGAAVHFSPVSGHAPGCTCCRARGEAGRALAWLLHARARGEIDFFTRVIAVVTTEGARADIRAALASDPIASTCFKAGPDVPASP